MDALAKGDVAAVKKRLAAKDANVNEIVWRVTSSYSNERRNAMIVLVAECKADDKIKCELAGLLLEARANPDASEPGDALSALYSTDCSPTLMRMLLTADPPANPNASRWNGYSPIYAHAQHGNIEQCQLLIDAKANVNYGDSPLLQALRHSSTKLVSVLLDAGADVSCKTPEGFTALTMPDNYYHTPRLSEGKAIVRKHHQSTTVLTRGCWSRDFFVSGYSA